MFNYITLKCTRESIEPIVGKWLIIYKYFSRESIQQTQWTLITWTILSILKNEEQYWDKQNWTSKMNGPAGLHTHSRKHAHDQNVNVKTNVSF